MKIGYARVSTQDQNLDLQIDALNAAGCEKIISEKRSGAIARREGLDKVLEFARAGDELVVWRLDRLGRTVGNLIGLVNQLEEKGVKFTSLNDGIDTSKASGKFFFHMMSAVAQMERDLLRERVQAGLKAAKKKGKVGGRPRAMTDKQFSKAKEMVASGMPPKEVAKKIKVTLPTLYRWLSKQDNNS